MPHPDTAVRRYEPLAPVAAALVIGILLGEYAGGGMFFWSAAALAAAASWLAFRLRGAPERWLLVPLMVLVAAAGAARYRANVDPAPDDVARLVTEGRRLVTLEGTVVRSARQTLPPDDVFLPGAPLPWPCDRPPSTGAGPLNKNELYMRSVMTLESSRALVDGRWVAASGRANVTIRQAMPQDAGKVPNLGDRIAVLGILQPFGRPANPGAFDIEAYLHRQGIRASLRTDRWEAVQVVEPAADRLRWAVGAVQRWARARLEPLPSKEGKAIVAAMLFGYRDWLDFDTGQVNGQDIERAFLATGTTHYLAVSGFNVGMVAAVVLILTGLAGLGRRLTAVVVAAAVLGFALMTELEPPVLRAAILFWVLCLGWFLGREALNLNSLGLAVVLVVLMRPGDLFTTSFQLSFLAVLGMMYVVGRLEVFVTHRFAPAQAIMGAPWRRSFWYRKLVRGTVLVSVAATVVNMPIIASRFHIVAWLAPVGSVILFPLVFALTVGGMALVAFGWAAPWLYNLLAAVPDGLGRTIAGTVQALANVPGAYFYMSEISTGWLFLTYGLLVAWVWRRRLGVPRRRLAMAVLVAAAAFVWTQGHWAPRGTRATFLAVSNGNCNLLELPNGRNILYDAGSVLGHARAAEATIAPALWSRHVDRLDAVFFSHAHFDHFKDILPLVDRFGVRQVFVPPTFVRRRLKCDKAVVEALLARGVRVEFFGAGDRLAGTGDVSIGAVWPRGAKSQTKAINDGSLVLAVADRGRRLLLTGDLQPASIQALLDAEPDLKADAMLWPHHGHEPQAVGRFAHQVGAKVLVVSAGRPYRPQERPAWMKARGVACYHTGEEGAVTLELRPEGVYAETFLGGPASVVAPDDGADAEIEDAEDD